MTQIVLLGAGSAQFSLQVITDLCLSPGLAGSHVVLVDTDASRLDWVFRLARCFVKALPGVDLVFSATTDRREALPGAAFVINTALAGGRSLMEKDRDLLEGCRYYRGIGINAPFRQLRLMLSIAEDVAEICPQATILQAANPLPEGCTLMTRVTGVNVIGVCHGYLQYRRLAALVGLDADLVDCEAVGINHCLWATRLTSNGEDLYPRLREWKRKVGPSFYRFWQGRHADYQLSPVTWHLFDLYGQMPIGDTARAIWPETWWYHVDAETKCHWYGPTGGIDGDLGHQMHLDWLASRLEQVKRAVQDERIPLTDLLPLRASEWQMLPLIDSIQNNRRAIHQVNIPNRGAIPELPDDFVVELPAFVDASGCQAALTAPLHPLVLHGAILPRWQLAERIIQATQTGDARFLLQTYLSDHKTHSFEQAQEALCALIEAPWNREMAGHYDLSVLKDL